MSTPLRVLMVEDSEDSSLLLKNELARGGYEVTYSRVDTAEAMHTALAEGSWDLVVSNHRLPRFSSLGALKLHKERKSDIPFIVVSGSLGEELAVGAMKAGADDYIMKDNLTRLVPTVERELREAASRRQRRRAEMELELCRRRTESILEGAGEGICGLDAKGRINFINPLGAKLVGWEAGELIGKSLHDTIHYSRADRAPSSTQDCSICATLREGVTHSTDGEVFCRKDGSAIPVEYTCVPMHEGQTIVGAVLTFQDITKRKDAEEALREANRRLECSLTELRQAQQQILEQERLLALGRMAGGVAHDFNNALSKILGFGELLLTSPDKLQNTETVRNHVQMINTAARDAGGVLRRLYAFYRPRRDTELFQPVNLSTIIEQAISLTKPKWKDEAQATGITIRIQTEIQPKVPVFADQAELREAVTNLVHNAVDALPQGGTITLRARTEAERAILEISDTGTGMTDEVRLRCFEPFFSTKGGAAAGLGLASVYGIIQRHGGEIRIHSKLGEGSTFSIRLPVHTNQPARRRRARSPVGSNGHPLHVLVVEDDPLVRGIEAEYLISDGHTVETAADGCEGMAKFHSGKFDLVLVDRAMPEINGDQLTEAIKEMNPDMPVILVTGFPDILGDDHNRRQANLILSKPFSHDSLRAAVGRATTLACSESRTDARAGLQLQAR
jgi:PAS domain S-box-containing protein